MEFIETEVRGSFLVRPEPRRDDRGWFARVFCAEEFATRGMEADVVQVNLAETSHSGTVRGLHYQLPPASEAKLVRCVAGKLFDVVVDVRPSSSTFGRWAGHELSATAGEALYVPVGCAHGYQALTDGAQALYHASAPYTPELERGLRHDDPGIGISWPLPPTNVSDKDRSLPGFDSADLPDL